MAFKALLGIVILIVLFGDGYGGGHGDNSYPDDHGDEMGMTPKKDENKDSMEKKKEEMKEKKKEGDKGKKMEKKDKKKEEMKDKKMDGKPMMCYSKKMGKGGRGMGGMKEKGMAETLLQQASRLLAAIMQQTGGVDEMGMDEMMEMIKGMMGGKEEDGMGGMGGGEEEVENTDEDLGQELLQILQRLPGVNPPMDGEHSNMPPPMNDEPMTGGMMPGLGGIAGFDLSALGLSSKDILNLLNDPSTVFLLQSFAPELADALQDPEFAALFSNLDEETLDVLLQSGQFFTPTGGVNMDAIMSLLSGGMGGTMGGDITTTTEDQNGGHDADDMGGKDDNGGMTMEGEYEDDKEKKTMKDMREGDGKSIIMIFDKIMAMAGINEEVTEENLIQSVMMAMQYIMEADKESLEALMSLMGELSQEDMEKFGMEMGQGQMSLQEMRDGNQKYIMEVFDMLMAQAGVEGEVNETNIMDAVMKAMQFVMSADEETLEILMETMKNIDLSKMGEQKRTMQQMREGDQKPLMMLFDQLMALAGFEGEVTEDNILEATMQAMQYIMSADEETLASFMQLLAQISEEMEKDGMMGIPELDDKDSMMAAFDKLMGAAGVGDVNTGNILESITKAMQFVMQADEETLQMLAGLFSQMGPKDEMDDKEKPMKDDKDKPHKDDKDKDDKDKPDKGDKDKPDKSKPKGDGKGGKKKPDKDKDDGKRGMKKPGKGKGKTMKDMREGDEKEIMELFDQIMMIAGIEGEVTEDNLLRATLQAMRFIMDADEDTLKMLMEQLGDLDMSLINLIGKDMMEDKYDDDDDMMEEGIEMVCYPMSEKDMMQYASMKGDGMKSTASIGTQTMGMGDDDEYDDMKKPYKETGTMMTSTGMNTDDEDEGKYKEGDTMKKEGCIACQKSMDEMKSTMQGMIKVEIEKAFSDIVQGMNEMTFVAPEIKFMLERMANGEMYSSTEKGDKKKDHFMEWTEWSQCEVMCGGGMRIRTRTCKEDYMAEMPVDELEMCEESEGLPCNTMPCEEGMNPVPEPSGDDASKLKDGDDSDMKDDDGDMKKDDDMSTATSRTIMKWDQWSDWDPCTQSCGGGLSIRSRMCMESYMAMYPDEICEESQSIICNDEPCVTAATVERVWGDYTAWSSCTAVCGGGTSMRVRTCLDNLPDCTDLESRNCNTQPCTTSSTIVSEWLEWEEWSPCSAICGDGTTTRRRQCVKKSAAESCEQVQSRSCNPGPCEMPATQPTIPEVPFWGDWGDWSICSATCGQGMERRTRVCNVPEAMNCVQEQERSCQIMACPTEPAIPDVVAWGAWGGWSICSATCGQGIERRRVFCTNSATVANCVKEEQRSCQIKICPLAPTPDMSDFFNGVWGRWSDWTVCTRTCGGGSRSRRRNCVSGVCIGKLTETESCNMQACSMQSFRPTPRPTGFTVRSTATSGGFVITSMMPAATGRCPASPYRHLRYQQSCIVFHGRESGKKTFSEYRSFCQERGGDIIKIDDVNEWVQVAYWMKGVMQGYQDKRGLPWIGSTDAGHRGIWTSPASMQRSFLIWSRGQPEQTSYDQCAGLNVASGHAYSFACSSENYAICEYKP